MKLNFLTRFLWISTSIIALLLPQVSSAAGERHKNGEVVVWGGTVYLIEKGERHGFRSTEEFWADGYTFPMVLPASEADLSIPVTSDVALRAASLVLDTSDRITIYLVYPGQAKPISSPPFIGFLGFDQRPIYEVNLSSYPKGSAIGFEFFYVARPSGTLVDDAGTVYLVKDQGLAPFASEAVFRSWGYDFNQIVSANHEDLNRPIIDAMAYRDGTVLNDGGTVYLISESKKYGFKTWAGFLSLGYSPQAIIAGSSGGYDLAGTFE